MASHRCAHYMWSEAPIIVIVRESWGWLSSGVCTPGLQCDKSTQKYTKAGFLLRVLDAATLHPEQTVLEVWCSSCGSSLTSCGCLYKQSFAQIAYHCSSDCRGGDYFSLKIKTTCKHRRGAPEWRACQSVPTSSVLVQPVAVWNMLSGFLPLWIIYTSDTKWCFLSICVNWLTLRSQTHTHTQWLAAQTLNSWKFGFSASSLF